VSRSLDGQARQRKERTRNIPGMLSGMTATEPLELENGVPDTRTGVTHAAALAVEDHSGARV
jgi:hypothetical protein